MSMFPPCTPNEHVGNARGIRKGLLKNNCKGLLPNNNTSRLHQNLLLNHKKNFKLLKAHFKL